MFHSQYINEDKMSLGHADSSTNISLTSSIATNDSFSGNRLALRNSLIRRRCQILAELSVLNQSLIAVLKEEYAITGEVPSQFYDFLAKKEPQLIRPLKNTSFPIPNSVLDRLVAVKSRIDQVVNPKELSEQNDIESTIESVDKKAKIIPSMKKIGRPTLLPTYVKPLKCSRKSLFPNLKLSPISAVDDSLQSNESISSVTCSKPSEIDKEIDRLKLDFEVVSQLFNVHKKRAEETKQEVYRKAYKSNAKKLKEISNQIQGLQASKESQLETFKVEPNHVGKSEMPVSVKNIRRGSLAPFWRHKSLKSDDSGISDKSLKCNVDVDPDSVQPEIANISNRVRSNSYQSLGEFQRSVDENLNNPRRNMRPISSTFCHPKQLATSVFTTTPRTALVTSSSNAILAKSLCSSGYASLSSQSSRISTDTTTSGSKLVSSGSDSALNFSGSSIFKDELKTQVNCPPSDLKTHASRPSLKHHIPRVFKRRLTVGTAIVKTTPQKISATTSTRRKSSFKLRWQSKSINRNSDQ